MTEVERLIRALAKGREAQTFEEERDDMKRIPESVSLDKAPKAVQSAYKRLRAAQVEEKAAKAVIEKAGFYGTFYGGPITSLRYSDVRERQETVKQRHAARRERITKLRTEAAVEALGKTPKEAGDILCGLRAALVKV